jgi:hypothetical protein
MGDTAHIDTIFKFLPHTCQHGGASIFFTAAMIHAFRSARSAVKNIDTPVLTHVWKELEYHIDVCHVTRGARIEYLYLSKKLFQFSCGCDQFH